MNIEVFNILKENGIILNDWTIKELTSWIDDFSYDYEWDGNQLKEIDLDQELDEDEVSYLSPKSFIYRWENNLESKYENDKKYFNEDDEYIKDFARIIQELKIVINDF